MIPLAWQEILRFQNKYNESVQHEQRQTREGDLATSNKSWENSNALDNSSTITVSSGSFLNKLFAAIC